MIFEIGKNGIASVDFNISLDWNSTKVKMIQPYEDKDQFYEERNRISKILEANIFSFDSVEVSYGSYSEKTFTELKKSVNALNGKSIINLQHRDEIIERLKEKLEQVKKESEQETKLFASFLIDFKTNIERQYKSFNRSGDLEIDDSIKQLDYLIHEVCSFRGNPLKVGSRWLYLMLSEGALEKLIQSLNKKEHNDLKEKIRTLQQGVTTFLKKYESELHPIIEKTINKNASWFQQLYKDYLSMVKTGCFLKKQCYGPLIGESVITKKLYLPNRFIK